jgi:hypothetical protein
MVSLFESFIFDSDNRTRGHGVFKLQAYVSANVDIAKFYFTNRVGLMKICIVYQKN